MQQQSSMCDYAVWEHKRQTINETFKESICFLPYWNIDIYFEKKMLGKHLEFVKENSGIWSLYF